MIERQIGFTEDFLHGKGGDWKWVSFDIADDYLSKIERPELWWSEELRPYYDNLIFPEQYEEAVNEVSEKKSIARVAEEKNLNPNTLRNQVRYSKELEAKRKSELKRRYKKENTFELAEEFGISPRTIRRIVNGK